MRNRQQSIATGLTPLTFLWVMLLCAFILAYMPAIAQKSDEINNEVSPTEAPSEELRPMIMIHGKPVLTKREKLRADFKLQIPESLSAPHIQRILSERSNPQIFSHNPQFGAGVQGITVVEFSDLACLQCREVELQLDKIRKKYADDITYVHMHSPVDIYNTSSAATFYGKIAQEMGTFWKYRELILEMKEFSNSIFMEKLLETGVDRNEVRRLIRSKSRNFYKQLDADAMYAKNNGITKPPVLFINGIKVDGKKISWDLVEDIINFEKLRLESERTMQGF